MTLSFFLCVATLSGVDDSFDSLKSRIIAMKSSELYSAVTDLRSMVGDTRIPSGSYPFLVLVDKKNGDASALDDLVTWGASHLNQLVPRLSDSTPTSLQVHDALTTDWYDPAKRSAGPRWIPEATTIWDTRRRVRSHRVTIGDICFFALGRITNRWFLPVRAEGIIIVNSPVLSEKLTAACTADYKTRTVAEVVRQLEADVREPDSAAREFFAVRRLRLLDRGRCIAAVIDRLRRVRAEGLKYAESWPRIPDVSLGLALSDLSDAEVEKELFAIIQSLAMGSGPLQNEDQLGIALVIQYIDDSRIQTPIRKYCQRRISEDAPNKRYFEKILARLPASG